MALKFYTASQNNSGGYNYENEDVQKFVIIEAESVEHASKKLSEITEDYSDYCPCCGERWDEFWDDEEGDDVPMIFDEPVTNVTDTFWNRFSAIIYYADGRKEIVELSGGERI